MMQVRILDVQQLDDLYSLSHPFLACPDTIQHLRQTKVSLADIEVAIRRALLEYRCFR